MVAGIDLLFLSVRLALGTGCDDSPAVDGFGLSPLSEIDYYQDIHLWITFLVTF